VNFELIDGLQQTFRKIVNELEALDFEEIESNLAEKFDVILVTLKFWIRVCSESATHKCTRTQLSWPPTAFTASITNTSG